MNWWEFSEHEEPAVASAPLASSPSPAPLARSRQERIADIEEEVHQEAATILQDALHFPEVLPGPPDADGNPTEPTMPASWIAELGEEGAMRRMRTAQLALSSSKDAPIGLKLAKDTLVGMAKVKAAKNAPARTLNMVVVQMTGPLPEFDELEVLK